MDNLDRWHAARKTQLAPQTLTLVERDMSRLLGVQDSELTRLLETTRAVNAEIRAIDGQMIDHANRRARLELAPVPATMQALQAKRRTALQAGLGRVQAALSSAAWNGVTGYINGGLRAIAVRHLRRCARLQALLRSGQPAPRTPRHPGL